MQPSSLTSWGYCVVQHPEGTAQPNILRAPCSPAAQHPESTMLPNIMSWKNSTKNSEGLKRNFLQQAKGGHLKNGVPRKTCIKKMIVMKDASSHNQKWLSTTGCMQTLNVLLFVYKMLFSKVFLWILFCLKHFTHEPLVRWDNVYMMLSCSTALEHWHTGRLLRDFTFQILWMKHFHSCE